jgi:hypothetical protein
MAFSTIPVYKEPTYIVGQFSFSDTTPYNVVLRKFKEVVLDTNGLPVSDLNGNLIYEQKEELIQGVIIKIISPSVTYRFTGKLTPPEEEKFYTIPATGYFRIELRPSVTSTVFDQKYYEVEYYKLDPKGRTAKSPMFKDKWYVPLQPDDTSEYVIPTLVSDKLSNPIWSINQVSQGSTVFVEGSDFIATPTGIDWKTKVLSEVITVTYDGQVNFVAATAIPQIVEMTRILVTRGDITRSYGGEYYAAIGNTITWFGKDSQGLALQIDDTIQLDYFVPSANKPDPKYLYTVRYTPAIDLSTITVQNKTQFLPLTPYSQTPSASLSSLPMPPTTPALTPQASTTTPGGSISGLYGGANNNVLQTLTYTQTTPQQRWVIVHNLRLFPIVVVRGPFGVGIPASITYKDNNEVDIQLLSPSTGTAVIYLVPVIPLANVLLGKSVLRQRSVISNSVGLSSRSNLTGYLSTNMALMTRQGVTGMAFLRTTLSSTQSVYVAGISDTGFMTAQVELTS